MVVNAETYEPKLLTPKATINGCDEDSSIHIGGLEVRAGARYATRLGFKIYQNFSKIK